MALLSRTKTTFAEYQSRDETNQIIELIDGEIVVNPPTDEHQKTLWRLIGLLLPRLTSGESRVAPTGLHLDDANSFEPDFFWISPQNESCILESNGRYWHGPPDLVVEIVSPSTAYHDRETKFRAYERCGVREYWLIEPQAQFVEVFILDAGRFSRIGAFQPGHFFTSSVVPGTPLAVRPLFE